MKALTFLGAALSFSATGAFLGEKIWLGAFVFFCIGAYAGQTFLKSFAPVGPYNNSRRGS